MKLDIQIMKLRDDLFIASCPKLPGCHVQASSKEQARRRIQEAIKLMISSYVKHREKLPLG